MSDVSVSSALEVRKAVRGYKPEPVPQEILEEIFTKAQQSPSNCNIQPWHVAVVSGDARAKLEETMIGELMGGKAAKPAFKSGDVGLDGVFKERQVDCAVRYWGAVGVTREDKAARNELMLRNWRFFGAPHVAFISMPRSMGHGNAIDIGIYLQTLMLLFVEYGLGSCPQAALAAYPDSVAELAGIPDDHGILCGISFGYPDDDAQVNTASMPREPLASNVQFFV